MEIIGKIIQACPIEQGTSKAGKPWKKRICVLETQETYPKKVAFTIFGEDKVTQYDPMVQPGATIRLSFDINSREFNGRWYTDIAGLSAYEVPEGNVAPAPQQAFQQPQPFQQPQQPFQQATPGAMPGAMPDFTNSGDESDLPF